MGVVLDSTVFIGGERRNLTVIETLDRARKALGDTEVVLSSMSALELIHGIWRARTPGTRARRQELVEEIFARVPVRPVSLKTARIAGEIDAKSRAKGVTIPTADLLIGATALELGFGVATANLRHFRLIPRLRVRSLE